MIRTTFFVALLSSLSALQAQSTVSVKGQITHPAGEYVYIRYYADLLTFDEVTVDSARLDDQGGFEMTFSCPKDGAATFYHGDEITDLYLMPGDDLYLTLDTEAFDESLTYTGQGAQRHNYIAARMLAFPGLDPTMLGMEEGPFIAYSDSLRTSNYALLEKWLSDPANLNAPERAFLNWEKANILYTWATLRQMYPAYRAYMARDAKFAPLSDNYYDFLDSFEVFDTTALGNMHYGNFLETYIERDAAMWQGKNNIEDDMAGRVAYMNSQLPSRIREFAYAQWLYSLLVYEGRLDDGLALFEDYKHTCPGSPYTGILASTVEDLKKLAPGNPAPAFTLPDRDGKPVSLADFKGKVVYMDIWATWCGPCVGEFPAMDKLIGKMEGKDVVFLGVSVDPDGEKWKAFLEKREARGIHLHSPGNFESMIARQYQVRGIPHYVLIDREGNIASANAPRPGGAQKEIEKLLAE